ncbi:MAG: 50S ribosomal protein L10 [Nitrososphaerota archaeon]|nr:50S ribosomal protein L10 [Nitrososphaerales archaeon]MDW8045485.1 50S ribosomal protein L10 [Nitrososphaerota archaeon]
MQVIVKGEKSKKAETISKIESLMKMYSVVAVAKLYKVRSAQLMVLRKKFRNDMTILVAKNTVASIAFERAGLPKEFTENLSGQNAFIFTNLSPFKLQLLLEKNKVNLPARIGDVATDDIVIPAGNTGIPPGPILSDFKALNIPTKIDVGSIWVLKDTVVAKKGDVITPKLAGLLSKLNIKPIRAGLSITFAYENGLLYKEDDLHLDLNQYKDAIVDAYQSVMKLSIAITYPTRETMPILILKGFQDAQQLAFNIDYYTKDNIGFKLAKAHADAIALDQIVRSKGFS